MLRVAAHREQVRARRGDDGSVVAVLVLTLVLLALASTAVITLAGGFTSASTKQSGEEATAQANAGIRDALFRLDQLGDTIAPFCVGSPPDSQLAAAGLSRSQCDPVGSAPLADAPGVRWYVARVLPELGGSSGEGVTDELEIVAYAAVKGQNRTVTTDVYRVADAFGMFGAAGFDTRGSLSGSNVFLTGGGGSEIQGGVVPIGVGPNGNANCNGGAGGSSFSNIVVFGGAGAAIGGSGPCPTAGGGIVGGVTNSILDAQAPTLCQTAEPAGAFAPCIYTANPARDANGDITCPLPGISQLADATATDAPLNPSPSDVYDCSTAAGAPVTITATSSQSIPPGNYYVDANNLTVQNVDSAALSAGPVSIYALPLACGLTPVPGLNCPVYFPTSSAANLAEPPGGSSCSLVPGYYNPSVSLSIGGFVNGTISGNTFTPGDPANFNLYWSGDEQVGTVSTHSFLGGYLYAPGAILNNSNSGLTLYGRLVLDCFHQSGSPTLIFLYPLHPRQFLTPWTLANYRITP